VSGPTLVGEADVVGSDTVGLPVGVTIDFADKNVGALKPMVLSSTIDPLVATDYLGKPVFGYTADIRLLAWDRSRRYLAQSIGIGTGCQGLRRDHGGDTDRHRPNRAQS
jgi:hypothetical protein